MTAKLPIPALDLLRAVFELDPDGPTGLKIRQDAKHRNAGSAVGKASTKGYFRMAFKGKHYAVHRIVWSMANDCLADPELEIDHRDGNRQNNRAENLRQCNRLENSQNLAIKAAKNATGLVGVSRRLNRWRAAIHLHYKRIYLGSFDTAEEAHRAYLLAKQNIHTFNPIPRDTK